MKKNAVKIHLGLIVYALLQLFLLLTGNNLPAQNIIGGSTGDPSAVLDLRSSDKGLLLPRMTTEERSAIINPAEGLLIYNTSLACVEINLGSSSNPEWACMLVLSGRLASLDCSGATYIAFLTPGESAINASFTLPYTGGGGRLYNAQSVSSTGVVGLTATLPLGAFASGSGSLTYTITGTPASAGTASFALSIGGQGCTLNIPVTPPFPATCGAFVASGVWKQFMCHNLGANMSADPLTPSWELIGNYYQWGRNPTCFGRDGIDVTNPCSSPVYGASGPWGSTMANDNAGLILGWNMTINPNDAWEDGVKTASDPCPAGFRVPTKAQWDGVANSSLNTRTFIGTWSSSSTNYSSGIRFGSSLLLPAAGNRFGSNGTLSNRGSVGYYWSSTENASSSAWYLYFLSGIASTNGNNRTSGFSVRCIAE